MSANGPQIEGLTEEPTEKNSDEKSKAPSMTLLYFLIFILFLSTIFNFLMASNIFNPFGTKNEPTTTPTPKKEYYIQQDYNNCY
jgi:hypothetical protein